MFWLVVTVGIIAIGLAMRALADPDPFEAAAASLGLAYSRSFPELLPRLSGTINRLPVRVDIPHKGAATIRYRVFYLDLGMALRLERASTTDRALSSLGSGDQEIGAKDFDEAFRVNTSRPDALAKMMTPELRNRLVGLVDRYPSVVIADGDITLISDTPEPTRDDIVHTVNDLVIVAVLLGANRPPPLTTPPSHRTAPPQERAPAAPAESAASGLPPTEPPKIESTASVPPALDESEKQPHRPEPAPVAAGSGLPDGFFEQAFGADRLSFETDDAFEKQLRGKKVTLSGPVKQARDLDAALSPIGETVTQAVVTVAEIESDLYGTTLVDAVVLLPVGRAAELARGDELTFRGKLDAIDPFMRTLTVIEAEIVDS